MKRSIESNKPFTEQEMNEKYGIDLDRFEVEKMEGTHWQQGQKGPDGKPVLIDLYRTAMKWKLKHPLFQKELEEVLRSVFGDVIPAHNKVVRRQLDGEIMAILLNTDKHIDRLEHDHLYLEQIMDRNLELSEQIRKRDIGRFIYADLGDLFNSNTKSKTKNDTVQHNNSTEAESFKIGLKHELKTFLELQKVFGGVEGYYLPGNHDEDKQNWMAQALNLYFTNNPAISIDDRALMRKYIEYGNVKVGLQHGHLVPRSRALDVFSSETQLGIYNYLIQGHIHHEMMKQYGPLIAQAIGTTANPSERERKNGYNTKGNIIAMLFHPTKGRIVTLEG